MHLQSSGLPVRRRTLAALSFLGVLRTASCCPSRQLRTWRVQALAGLILGFGWWLIDSRTFEPGPGLYHSWTGGELGWLPEAFARQRTLQLYLPVTDFVKVKVKSYSMARVYNCDVNTAL